MFLDHHLLTPATLIIQRASFFAPEGPFTAGLSGTPYSQPHALPTVAVGLDTVHR